jgi:hypothetical protein
MMIALMIFGCSIYLLATEYITEQKSEGEILLFQRGNGPSQPSRDDEESAGDSKLGPTSTIGTRVTCKGATSLPSQTSTFQWEDVSFDIGTKGKKQQILQDVDGWIKPGTLTALMVNTLSSPSFSICSANTLFNRVSQVLARRHCLTC